MRRVTHTEKLWLDLVLCAMVAVLLVLHWRQAERVNELWREAWLHAVDDGTRVETTGTSTTVTNKPEVK